MRKLFTSMGIMSGTSMDGIDISLINSDGDKIVASINDITYKYPKNLEIEIKNFITFVNKGNTKNISKNINYLKLEDKFNIFVKNKILDFCKRFNFSISKLDVIGLHGHTIYHNPNKKISLQVGSGEFLSNYFQTRCVFNFRNSDIKNGGQGAPLVPIFHKAIFKDSKITRAVVNIGGITNITLLGKKNTLISSDIGPGNVLIDKFSEIAFKKSLDFEGKNGSKGNLIPKLLNLWLNKSFIKKKIPKSFDNFFFNLGDYILIDKILPKNKTINYDIICTLTYFTAKIIELSKVFFKDEIDEWIICGGGSKNVFLMNILSKKLKKVLVSDKYGWNSDFVESQAFAYLAIRRIISLPSTFPGTTGVQKPTVCGELVLKSY